MSFSILFWILVLLWMIFGEAVSQARVHSGHLLRATVFILGEFGVPASSPIPEIKLLV